MVVLISIDDLLCFYHESSNFCQLLDHVLKFSLLMSQEVPVLTFLTLQIVHLKHGIRFDQKFHINKTIIDVWFPNPTEPIGTHDTPFFKNTIYKHENVDSLTIPPKELFAVENNYRGLRYNPHIRKKLFAVFVYVYLV